MNVYALIAPIVLAPFLSRLLCRWLGLVKPNFRGERIPSALGLTFVLIAVGYQALIVLFPPPLPPNTTGQFNDYDLSYYQNSGLGRPFYVVLIFGLLGFIDDRWGNRSVGGFRGHLRSLFSGKPTTGALKLVGGGLAALWCVWPSSPEVLLHPEIQEWLKFPVGAALIALSANTVNLLDLRPGRAYFGFLLLLLPSLVLPSLVSNWVGAFQYAPNFGFRTVLVGALIEWPFDARAKGMLGDTGSNFLGALAGIAAVGALPLWGQVVMLSVLLLLNALAERYSITATIEKTPWLRWIDRRLGVR